MKKTMKVFILFVACYFIQCAIFDIPLSMNIAYRALFGAAVLALIYLMVTSQWWKKRVLKLKEY